jgi:hypothetical protein
MCDAGFLMRLLTYVGIAWAWQLPMNLHLEKLKNERSICNPQHYERLQKKGSQVRMHDGIEGQDFVSFSTS